MEMPVAVMNAAVPPKDRQLAVGLTRQREVLRPCFLPVDVAEWAVLGQDVAEWAVLGQDVAEWAVLGRTSRSGQSWGRTSRSGQSWGRCGLV